jgi:hypothetical protein
VGGCLSHCDYLLRVISIRNGIAKRRSQSIQSSDHDNYNAGVVLISVLTTSEMLLRLSTTVVLFGARGLSNQQMVGGKWPAQRLNHTTVSLTAAGSSSYVCCCC